MINLHGSSWLNLGLFLCKGTLLTQQRKYYFVKITKYFLPICLYFFSRRTKWKFFRLPNIESLFKANHHTHQQDHCILFGYPRKLQFLIIFCVIFSDFLMLTLVWVPSGLHDSSGTSAPVLILVEESLNQSNWGYYIISHMFFTITCCL